MAGKSLALLTTALLTVLAAAQPRPDFSGTWRMDEARSGSPGHDSFVGPVQWVIKQTNESMVVEMREGEQTNTYTYTLYDTRPTDPIAAPSFRGYFEGDRLITEALINIQGKTVTMRQERTLSADGREMTVERLVEVEHGYTAAQNFSTVKDVFTRVAP